MQPNIVVALCKLNQAKTTSCSSTTTTTTITTTTTAASGNDRRASCAARLMPTQHFQEFFAAQRGSPSTLLKGIVICSGTTAILNYVNPMTPGGRFTSASAAFRAFSCPPPPDLKFIFSE